MRKLISVLLAVLFVCALSGLAVAGKISQDGTGQGQVVDLNFVGSTVTTDGNEATITTNALVDDAALTFGTGDDASIYFDSGLDNLVLTTAQTFEYHNNCVILQSPDASFSQCCTSDSDTFTCLGL